MLLIITGLALMFPAGAVSLPLGDALELSGYAPGADTVYLFLTGPNLPANGVRLDDISVPVVTGVPATFVSRPVASDGSWEYSWITRTAGGVPDAGTYTVYVVTTPTGRTDLSSKDSYAVIAVTLTRPTLTATIGGRLTITSEPSGADVLVDGELQGSTPMKLTNVSAGDHTVEIIKEGYLPATVNTTVNENENATVERTLEPLTTPAATVSAPSPSPTRIAFPVATLLAGLGIALARSRDR